MTKILAEFQFTTDIPEFSIVYSEGFIAIGIQATDRTTLSVALHPNSAMKLLLELREAMRDFAT